MSSENGEQSDLPVYGTEAYARWYRKNFGEGANPGVPFPMPPAPQPPVKKSHRGRWILAGVAVLVVVAAIIGGLSNSGGSGKHLAKAGATAAASKSTQSPVPCVNSASMCPASDPTDHSVPSEDASSEAPSEAPSSPDAPAFDAIGSTLDYTESNGYDDSDDAEANITVSQIGTYTAAIRQDEFGSNEAPHEGTYRVFKVKLEVVSGTIDDIDSGSFRWESSTGRVFDESEGNSYESGFDSDEELDASGGAAVGQSVEGDLIFDVPAGAGKLELTNFDNTIIGGWTVTH